MQTSLKQFQINIINTVILNHQTALAFKSEAPASFSDIQTTPEKVENWFTQKVGDKVQTLSLFGFTGVITITSTDHAQDLHCIAQAAGYRFIDMPVIVVNRHVETLLACGKVYA